MALFLRLLIIAILLTGCVSLPPQFSLAAYESINIGDTPEAVLAALSDQYISEETPKDESMDFRGPTIHDTGAIEMNFGPDQYEKWVYVYVTLGPATGEIADIRYIDIYFVDGQVKRKQFKMAPGGPSVVPKTY